MESLRAAAFLHDVGHMTLPSGGDGFEAPGHCEDGEKIVAGANFSPDVVTAVRHHHDRWDGSTDPAPLMARILAVAERFEATTAARRWARLRLQVGVGVRQSRTAADVVRPIARQTAQ